MALNFRTEFNKVVSSVLADLVKTEYFTEWQAGFVFGYLQSKLSVFDNNSDIDFSDDSVGFANFGEQPILNREIYYGKESCNGIKSQN